MIITFCSILLFVDYCGLLCFCFVMELAVCMFLSDAFQPMNETWNFVKGVSFYFPPMIYLPTKHIVYDSKSFPYIPLMIAATKVYNQRKRQ